MSLKVLEFLLKWKSKIAEANAFLNVSKVSKLKAKEMDQELRNMITKSSFKGFMKMILGRDQVNSSLKMEEDTKDFSKREDLKEWEFI